VAFAVVGYPHPLRAITAPLRRRSGSRTVSGVRKSSRRSSASCAAPVKRSRSSPGSRWVATGGMKRAHCACHRGVTGNCACHHWRQRSRVRIGIASASAVRAAAGVCPACRADTSTTANPRYTRRPRKRTDIAVHRLRQRLQQKLKRLSKSSRTSTRHARGLRG
jgi:hypothetical protein